MTGAVSEPAGMHISHMLYVDIHLIGNTAKFKVVHLSSTGEYVPFLNVGGSTFVHKPFQVPAHVSIPVLEHGKVC